MMKLDPPPKQLDTFTKREPLPQISSRGAGGGDERASTPDSDSDNTNRQNEDQLSETSESSSVLLEHPKEASRLRLTQTLRREHDSDSAGGDTDKSTADVKKPDKRNNRKMNKFSRKKTTAVTLETQTDWDWLESALQQGKVKTILATDNIFSDEENDVTERKLPSASKSDSREASSHGRLSAGEAVVTAEDSKTDQLASPFPAISEEFGIPILALSSDTDDSSDEEISLTKSDRKFVTNVGPPPILQYNRERDAEEEKEKADEDREEDEYEDIDTSDFPVDEDGNQLGMFGGVCEFCNEPIRPFPTLEQQQRLPPEDLYCCSDYKEFISYTMELDSKSHDGVKVTGTMINVKPHAHHGSKKARQNAKERAVHRLREREIARRQQEASQFHQGQRNQAMRTGGGAAGLQSGPQASGSYKDVVRQMKTINYQLSSQRCLEEGWTLRPPSPLNEAKEEDVFVPEPINPALISSGKFRDRPIIEKFYPDGTKFLTMFPDGSGNVFYPSGNLAIMISTVTVGQYNYIIHDDDTEDQRNKLLAVFEPSGFASCYNENGAIRLHLDQYGGIELDHLGGKRRKWSWKDEENHVHAPPFQPIRFALNHWIGIRVMSQANIIVTMSVKTRSCRFNVGSRLRMVAPQNIPQKEVDNSLLFLEETKFRVDALLDKVSTLLKFPKSPKIEKILPPLHITSKKQKTERMKRDKAGSVMTNKSRQSMATSASVTVN